MIPVFQEIIDKGRGDCFSAAVASLLEIPLEDVPKFRLLESETGKRMMDIARAWLAENYNLSCITIQMEKELESGEDMRIIGAFANTPCIAGGKSPNIPDCSHAVVGRLDESGLNFEMTFDPNPSGKGILGKPTHLYFFVPLNPENFVKKWKGFRFPTTAGNYEKKSLSNRYIGNIRKLSSSLSGIFFRLRFE